MNILLVKPNLLRPEDREGHGSSLLLGLLSIASYVDDPAHLRIAVYPDDRREIRASLPWADAVGFSACTFEYETVRRLARELRAAWPGKRWFIGGEHVSLLGTYDARVFDFMVRGEGEKPVRDLVTGAVAPPRGRHPRILEADAPLAIEELPLVDFRLYPSWRRLRGGRASLVASRGCRFRACRFCTSSRFSRGLRRLPPERVVEQLALTTRTLETREVNVWDDSFTDDPGYLAAIGGGLRRAGVRLRGVSCFARTTSAMDPEVFPLLAGLGVQAIVTGHESGSERLLRYLKGPRSSVAHNRANCLRARDAGFAVMGSVMLGAPTETLGEMGETVALLRWLRREIPGTRWVYVATPLPGSQFWKTALERGTVRPDMDFDTLSFDRHETPLLLDPGVDRRAFARVIRRAEATAHGALPPERRHGGLR